MYLHGEEKFFVRSVSNNTAHTVLLTAVKLVEVDGLVISDAVPDLVQVDVGSLSLRFYHVGVVHALEPRSLAVATAVDRARV